MTPNYAVTAATCTLGDEKKFKVRSRTSFRKQGGSIHQVKKFIRHDNFTTEKDIPYNDLAIIHVENRFVIDGTCPKADLLNEEKFNKSALLSVVGFGLGGNGAGNQMKVYEVREENEYFCDLFYAVDDNSQICSGYINFPGGNASLEDVGSPMFFKGHLFGILSFLKNYEGLPVPEIYTRISHFRKWIDDNVVC